MSLFLKIKEQYLHIRQYLIAKFLFRAIIIYILWLVFYKSELFDISPLDDFLIDNLMKTSAFILDLFGYSIFQIGKYIGIENSSGVEIGPPCNAFSLFVLYAGFLLAFPGNGKKKSIYIPVGILIIHLLNLARVLALILLAYYNPSVLEFNHSYTFTLIIYACIFGMWMHWIKKSSGDKVATKS